MITSIVIIITTVGRKKVHVSDISFGADYSSYSFHFILFRGWAAL